MPQSHRPKTHSDNVATWKEIWKDHEENPNAAYKIVVQDEYESGNGDKQWVSVSDLKAQAAELGQESKLVLFEKLKNYWKRYKKYEELRDLVLSTANALGKGGETDGNLGVYESKASLRRQLKALDQDRDRLIEHCRRSQLSDQDRTVVDGIIASAERRMDQVEVSDQVKKGPLAALRSIGAVFGSEGTDELVSSAREACKPYNEDAEVGAGAQEAVPKRRNALPGKRGAKRPRVDIAGSNGQHSSLKDDPEWQQLQNEWQQNYAELTRDVAELTRDVIMHFGRASTGEVRVASASMVDLGAGAQKEEAKAAAEALCNIKGIVVRLDGAYLA
eukprot:COSAG01_NODE_17530_length_1143_cov_3.593870_1_plen_331_part_10